MAENRGEAVSTDCTFDVRPYRRPFVRPLHTHHGLWREREGAIVRLRDRRFEPARESFGEIAPLPWFGSETLAEALDYCRSLPEQMSSATIAAIPDRLPATRFAIESAWRALSRPSQPFSGQLCGLLPTGAAALEACDELLETGFATLKWKIGVTSAREEMRWCEQLRDRLPASVQLRLDANGGLNRESATKWLYLCDRLAIEFLEQPLPPTELSAMFSLANQYSTPLALDESVATLSQLREICQRNWPGIVVIKPAIAGSPSQLIELCRNYSLDVVLSSALETSVGRAAALSLAEAIGTQRALGFGVDRWFPPESIAWPQELWQTSF